MFNWLLIFKQEMFFFQRGWIYRLEPIWADEMFNTCLKGGPAVLVVPRNPKIKLSPGTVLLGLGSAFLTFASQQKSLRNTRPGRGNPEQLYGFHLMLASDPIITAINDHQKLITCQALC